MNRKLHNRDYTMGYTMGDAMLSMSGTRGPSNTNPRDHTSKNLSKESDPDDNPNNISCS